MKIKLSKSQWEEVGKKAGWMKESQCDYFDHVDRMFERLEGKPKKKQEEKEIDGDFDDDLDPEERQIERERTKNDGDTDWELNEKLKPGSK